jgi:hypothetical protein
MAAGRTNQLPSGQYATSRRGGLGDAEELIKLYPRHKSTIEKYSRKSSHPNI